MLRLGWEILLGDGRCRSHGEVTRAHHTKGAESPMGEEVLPPDTRHPVTRSLLRRGRTRFATADSLQLTLYSTVVSSYDPRRVTTDAATPSSSRTPLSRADTHDPHRQRRVGTVARREGTRLDRPPMFCRPFAP
jgi:hypothetical protein